MSGLDECWRLPICPNCRKEPDCYAVGPSTNPWFWVNSKDHAKRWSSAYLDFGEHPLRTEQEVRRGIGYVYCLNCGVMHLKESNFAIVEKVVEMAIQQIRRGVWHQECQD